MKVDIYLLPGRLRPVGIIFLILGLCILFLKYQFNYKPDFLEVKVFAIYSFYIEAKSFTFITQQIIEEIGGSFVLSGLFLIAFTKEKKESEIVDILRLQSFFIASYLNFLYLLISVIFFYGFGFVGALTIFVIFWLVSYILIFRYRLYRYKKKQL